MLKPKRSLLHRLFSRKRWRWVQRSTGVHRIHHPRWSFGWRFPFTAWCRFQTEPRANHDKGGALEAYAPGWQRCARETYHDCTATGRY